MDKSLLDDMKVQEFHGARIYTLATMLGPKIIGEYTKRLIEKSQEERENANDETVGSHSRA